MSLIFAPDDYVPLSAFSNTIVSGMVTLEVRSDILDWLEDQSATVRVARKNILGLTYFDEPTVGVDVQAGTVTLATTTPGVYVAVSDELVNAFPIVTHWNQDLNDDRGGFESGATDGIGYRDFNPETNAIEEGGNDVNNHNPAWRDESSGWGTLLDNDLDHPFRQYQFASDIYAVFSDGEETDHDTATVPAHERYIGESWSEHSVTDLAAVFLSDQARIASGGYPIVHRNEPDAFENLGDPAIGLREDLPAFQLAHCHEIEVPDPGDLIPGKEGSLATYLLPPYWEAPPPNVSDGLYPILFTGYYGIHSTTFHIPGLQVIEGVGRLLVEEGHSAMGVMWNGGGSGACQTMQGSAYEGVWLAFEAAQDLANGDPEEIVAIGGSRGGWTGLAVASNPDEWPYTVRYALIDNPQTRPGELAEVFTDPAHHIVQLAIASAAGYALAWRSDWTGPAEESGATRAVRVLTGAEATGPWTIFEVADKSHAVYANRFLTRLSEEGTGVVIRASTHDIAKPFKHMVEYFMKARHSAFDIPMKLEVHHRFGHQYYVDSYLDEMNPDVVYFLDQLFEANPVAGLPSGMTGAVDHWQRYAPPDHSSAALMEPAPDPKPLVLEGPLLVGYDQAFTWTVTGEPGTEVTLVRKTVQTLPDVLGNGEEEIFSDVVLPGTSSDAFGTYVHEDVIPHGTEQGDDYYWHFLRYTLPGDPTVYETQLPSSSTVDTATPHIAWPLMKIDFPVVAAELSPQQFLGMTDESRTGGVSTEGELAGPP